MKKSLIACLACVGLLSAGVATATAASDKVPDPAKVAKKQCNAQKKADPAAFEAAWGDKHTMQNCKKATVPEAEDTVQNASQECKAAAEADPTGFQTTYGENNGNGKGDGKNAHGKCVSSTTKEAVAEEVAEFKNAAKECRAERTADPAAFTATYGTNGNKKNAFGKCVSSKVKDDSDEVAA